jgi:alpha-2-macroglobulin
MRREVCNHWPGWSSGDVLQSGEFVEVEPVEVELTLESKNDYEYLLFEDMKPAGYEPDDLRSGYTWEGLGAYRELPGPGCAGQAPRD